MEVHAIGNFILIISISRPLSLYAFESFRDVQEKAFYKVLNEKPSANGSPGYYWISWKNGLVVFGFGQDIGKGTLMVHNDHQPVEIHNATASLYGTLNVPFRYYVGMTGLCNGFIHRMVSRKHSLPNIDKADDFMYINGKWHLIFLDS